VPNAPVSAAELERRRAAVRAAMERAGIDVLVLGSSSEDMGGYVRYLTDMPAGGYGTVVVFPRDGEPAVVNHGFQGELTSPYFPSVAYTRGEPGRLALRALRGYERATVGLVGTTQLPLAVGDAVREGLPEARFVEASELLDEIKAVKSAEEQQQIRGCAELQDAALEAAFAAAEPGVRESDVGDAAWNVAYRLGSEAGIVLIGSGPPGGGWTIKPRHLQTRTLEEGDMLAVLVEVNGPGGQFAEIGRTAVLGDVPAQVEEELELVLEAQRFTLERLVPGARCADVWDEYNAFLRERGRPEEARIHCHGQGVDLVERPLVRFDETMAISEGMNITCHPTWLLDGLWSWICDNYLIGPDGPGECLHATPQRIVSL